MAGCSIPRSSGKASASNPEPCGRIDFVKATAEDFRRHFALLSDEALLEVHRDDLVDVAQSCYDQEVSERKLNADEEGVPEEPSGESADQLGKEPAGEPSDVGALVSIASFTTGDEAGLARGLLTSAGIPCFLENEKAALGALHLMVPATLVEEALQVLGPGALSDDELAAQAEAAGSFEHEDPEEVA
jgi:hypothetical protein